MTKISEITSRENERVKRWKRLSSSSTAYREEGLAWMEGEHLVQACADRGGDVETVLIRESRAQDPQARALAQRCHAKEWVVLADRVFDGLCETPSPQGIAALWRWSPAAGIDASLPTLVLDRVQDAGNVGTLLRSASVFGIRQVVALKGTAALGSPKVLRSAMGAHLGLRCVEQCSTETLLAAELPLIATSSHAALAVHETALPALCGWVMGHEGQGVAEAILAACQTTVRIPQPGGEESLNVGVAASICLYEWARQRGFRA
ncbi:MAG: RNA methyltransferase [Burkholderiaceae bacterium]|nr:MAG: RNA methyltransferase [Burkholderiaceae bacterium]